MVTISLRHASFILSFLYLSLTISFPATTAELQLHVTSSNTLPPLAAPSPTPSHHHNHHRHHLSHHVSLSPAHSPTAAPPHSHAWPPVKSPPVHHRPTKAPTPAAAPYYSKPPTTAPALSPYIKPPRKLVAVEGVVFCNNCSSDAINSSLLGASPLSGAMVELRCRNTKYLLKKTATTDKNGYFFLQAPNSITTYGAHKCRVFLVQSPKNSGGPCSHATNLNDGVSGAFLFLDKNLAPPTKPLPFTLFTVGPFAFEPLKCYKH